MTISPRCTAGYCPAGVVDKGRRAGRHTQCPLEPVALPRAWPRLSPLRGPGWSRGGAGIARKLFCHDGSCAGTVGASESPRLREKPLQGSIPAHLHLARPGCQNTGWWVGAWATRSTGGSQGRQTPGSPLCQAGDGHPKSALGETAGPASAEHLAGQPEYLQGDNMAMARVPWWQGQGYTEMQRLRQGGHVQGS